MSEAIQDLIEISHYAAQHIRFVQGGGGNCSVKFSGKLAIKASGYNLEEVSEKKGWAIVDLRTGQAVDKDGPKFSMETHLHQILNTYVIHTHPIAVAALICSRQGKENFRRLFPDPLYRWLDYAAPGRSIAEKAKKELEKSPLPPESDCALFLQNHGLFISSATKDGAIQLHEDTVVKLEKFFGDLMTLDLPPIPENRFLTPDHVVYTFRGETSKEKWPRKLDAALREVQDFIREVLALMAKKHWEPAWLSDQDVHVLTDMGDEKYRQKLWRTDE
ncbi:MAG: class II aldolase/adducin family protein [Candidatus Omnitrophica bacterium]|nr:class II aldolase/adducin family protein [Candidatus Omnitrophota bacterium]